MGLRFLLLIHFVFGLSFGFGESRSYADVVNRCESLFLKEDPSDAAESPSQEKLKEPADYAAKYNLKKEVVEKMLAIYGELPSGEQDLVFQTLSLTINDPHLSKYEIATRVFNSKARENVKILIDFINEAKKAPQFLSITELQQKNFYKVEAYLQKLFSQPTINYFEETIAMIDYSHLGTHLADHQHLLLSEFIPANGNRFDNFDQQYNHLPVRLRDFVWAFKAFPYQVFVARVLPRKPNGEIPHLSFTPFIKTFGIGVNYYQPVPIFDALEVDGAKMDSSFFVDHDFGHGNATLKNTHMYYFQSQKSGQEHFIDEHLNQSLKWKKINNQMESMINGLAPEERGLTRLTWFYFTHEIAISPQRLLKRYDEGKTQILGIKYNKFLSVVERNLKLRLGTNDLAAGLIVKRPGSAAIKRATLNIIQVLESLPEEDLPLENLQAPPSLPF